MTQQDLFLNKYYYKEGNLYNIKTNKILRNKNTEGYLRVRIDGKEYRTHRVIWIMHFGEIPEGYLIDHINGIKDDNRLENLRLATRIQNNVNSVGSSKIGLPKGVQKSRKRFRAKIYHKGITYCLGTFDTPEEASEAYKRKSIELHGEFAKTCQI